MAKLPLVEATAKTCDVFDHKMHDNESLSPVSTICFCRVFMSHKIIYNHHKIENHSILNRLIYDSFSHVLNINVCMLSNAHSMRHIEFFVHPKIDSKHLPETNY